MDFYRLFKNVEMTRVSGSSKSRQRRDCGVRQVYAATTMREIPLAGGGPIDSLCAYQEPAPFISVSNMVFIRI
jgi:hypothetical protein